MDRTEFEHAECPLDTAFGTSVLHCYQFGAHEEDNLLVIDCLDRADPSSRPVVRVQSACYTAEIFRSTDCDCHEQLEVSLRRIHDSGGLLAYMICDGRGAGLLTKVRGLGLGATAGLDTHDAYEQLGSPIDPRRYDRVAAALLDLEVSEISLLTNNPRKTLGLSDYGIDVIREPLLIEPTAKSEPYLRTKATKMGHLLPQLSPLGDKAQ